jgi:adenylate cyclase
MSAMDDFDTKLTRILYANWNIQDARVVPKTEDIAQRDGAKRLEATYLYADMADSTALVKNVKPEIAARVIRAYLRIAVDCIRAQGGHIRSFDGDRVMGIFIGPTRRNDAVVAALNISWVVEESLNPKLSVKLWDAPKKFKVIHRSGIDDGATFIVRGGARDNSDLVSIGDAPNIAAKLSAIRGEGGSIAITDRVYSALFEHNKIARSGETMWRQRPSSLVGPHFVKTYSCGWMRQP